jgi:LPXTG-motif cell wall-anchored protein
VTNHGAGPATGVVIRDTVPAGLTITAVTPKSCTVSGQEVACPVGDLPAGASASATVEVTVTKPGTYANTGHVTAVPHDPVAANNTATATLHVRAAPPPAPPPTPASGSAPPLANTGVDVGGLLATGLGLLAAGGLALLVSRRRRA